MVHPLYFTSINIAIQNTLVLYDVILNLRVLLGINMFLGTRTTSTCMYNVQYVDVMHVLWEKNARQQ